MDGRGAGSYVMLGSAPPGPSFLVSPSVKLLDAGSCVLIPDLVVMAKVGALGLGVLLLLIVERNWEYCSRNFIQYVSSRQAYLLGWVALLIFISLMGSSAIIANQVGVFKANLSSRCFEERDFLTGPFKRPRSEGCIASEMEETKGAEAELGELIEFPVVNLRHVVVKDLNHKPFLYPMMSSDTFVVPLFESED
ncbi:hypothetical protein Tco_0146406 [Tanacetum coccineum]